jgi:hypothetical protein
MNKLIYLLILLFSFSVLSAQEKLSKKEKVRRENKIQLGNPFKKFGYKAKVATLSNGKYLEFHDLDSIVIIGTIRWHAIKNIIVGRIIQDSLNPDKQPIGDRAGRWISQDPLSEEFPSWSPYNFCFGNPLKFVDPDGRAPEIIQPTFQNETVKQDYLNTVNSAMGGMYTATADPILGGIIQLSSTGIAGPMTEQQQAFHDEYQSAIDSPFTATQSIVERSVDTNVGNWITGKVDMADVSAFDKAGKGGATSAGAIIHETKEQIVKSEMGLKNNETGTRSNFQTAHQQATQAENKVNGNTRVSNNTYLEKNSTTTKQTITPNETSGRNTVTKEIIPN